MLVWDAVSIAGKHAANRSMAEETSPQDSSTSQQPEELAVRRPRRPKPKHEFPQTQAGKLWEALGNPEEPANTMAGGMVNTAGGKPPEVTWRDAFRFSQFSKADLTRFYRTQCSRDALLVGIGAGGAVGGLRFIIRGKTPPAPLYRFADFRRTVYCRPICQLCRWHLRRCCVGDVLLVRSKKERGSQGHGDGCGGYEDA